MIVEVKVPQLSESVAEATLLDWHKKEGERVSRDENLIDIETDKVVLELPAPADGVLVTVDGQPLDPRRDLRDLGAEGFEWGYEGTGPAQLSLAILADLYPAGVLAEVMNDDGTMARLPELVSFAQRHGLKIATIADLIVGLPLDRMDDIKYSFEEVFKLHAPELQLGFLKFLKGTPVREKYLEHGFVFDPEPPYQILKSNYLSEQELQQITQLEHALEIYWTRAIRPSKVKQASCPAWLPLDAVMDMTASEMTAMAGMEGRLMQPAVWTPRKVPLIPSSSTPSRVSIT